MTRSARPHLAARTTSARNPPTVILRFTLRGGVVHLAAPLFSALCWPGGAGAQAPVRSRDASLAVVRYENGLTASALTLYDAVVVADERASRSGNSLVSIFHDGRVSLQGWLEGARRSAAIPVTPRLAPLFSALRGEVLLNAATTIQSGYMPTAALTGRARVRFERTDQGAHAEAAVARAFDGRLWQTVVMGEARAWWRRGDLLGSVRAAPMQLGIGDVLGDFEGQLEWSGRRGAVSASLGARLGEALRGTTAWGGVALTWPVWYDAWVTASAGSYAADLVQNLPAGRYLSVSLRLPNGRLPAFRPPPPPPPPPPPRTPDLPVTHRLALVIGPALDSTGIREVKVWAPGAQRVELLADFVDWIPAPLIRQPGGAWQGYYRIPAGLHRVNLRLDGAELDAPVNWRLERDEFLGTVALVIVR